MEGCSLRMPKPIFKKVKFPSKIPKKGTGQLFIVLAVILVFSVTLASYKFFAENSRVSWCKKNFVKEQELVAKKDWKQVNDSASKILEKCKNNADSAVLFNLNHDLALSNFLLGNKEQAKPYAKQALNIYGKLSAEQRNEVGFANTKIFVVSDIHDGIYKEPSTSKVEETPLSEVKR